MARGNVSDAEMAAMMEIAVEGVPAAPVGATMEPPEPTGDSADGDVSICTNFMCQFCGKSGGGGNEWRSKEVCRRCYNVARQAYRSVTPRQLLKRIRSSEEQQAEWTRTLQAYENRSASGMGRIHLGACTVSRGKVVERRVEEAPFRWVLETDYAAIFGRTSQEDGRTAQWEFLEGQWEWGHRLYEFDPRLRRITDSRLHTVQMGQQLDVGTEDGGELRPGQLAESFNLATAAVSGVGGLDSSERAARAKHGPTVEGSMLSLMHRAAGSSSSGSHSVGLAQGQVNLLASGDGGSAELEEGVDELGIGMSESISCAGLGWGPQWGVSEPETAEAAAAPAAAVAGIPVGKPSKKATAVKAAKAKGATSDPLTANPPKPFQPFHPPMPPPAPGRVAPSTPVGPFSVPARGPRSPSPMRARAPGTPGNFRAPGTPVPAPGTPGNFRVPGAPVPGAPGNRSKVLGAAPGTPVPGTPSNRSKMLGAVPGTPVPVPGTPCVRHTVLSLLTH